MQNRKAGSAIKSSAQFSKMADLGDKPRSIFDRSSTYTTTFDAGLLIPVQTQEIYPGDSVKQKLNFVIRLATPLFPSMSNIIVDFHTFFVPSRILMKD